MAYPVFLCVLFNNLVHRVIVPHSGYRDRAFYIVRCLLQQFLIYNIIYRHVFAIYKRAKYCSLLELKKILLSQYSHFLHEYKYVH